MGQQWVSLRAYARHRGVRLSAVQKAIESQRVTAIREEGGRITGIDLVEADKQWAANTDATESLRNGKTAAALQLTPAPGPGGEKQQPAAGAPLPGDQGDFLAARVREAQLRGEILELDKLERIEELLPRSVVSKMFSEIFSELKSAVSRIPDRKAQALAGEVDPARVHRILSDEIRAVFDDYSRRLAGPAGLADDASVARERETVLP